LRTRPSCSDDLLYVEQGRFSRRTESLVPPSRLQVEPAGGGGTEQYGPFSCAQITHFVLNVQKGAGRLSRRRASRRRRHDQGEV